MITVLRQLTLLFATVFLIYLAYLGFAKDQSQPWTTFKEPALASFTTLEQDAEILDDLDQQTEYDSYKPIADSLFTKPTIFSTY